MKPTSISRRKLMAATTLGVLGQSAISKMLHAAGESSCPQPVFELQSPLPTQPDIVFVSVDDLNDWVSPLLPLYTGGRKPPMPVDELRALVTPNFDRFAAKAMTFQRAYTEAPACGPARSAVLSGIAPWKSGAVDVNQDVFAFNSSAHCGYTRPPPNRSIGFSLPAALKAGGYTCYGAGKTFHSFLVEEIKKGAFHETTGFGTSPRVPGAVDISGQVVPLDSLEGEFDDRVADWSIDRITANAGSGIRAPMFLAIGFSRPHIPWNVDAQRFADIHRAITVVPDYMHEGEDQNDLGLAHCVGLRDRPGWSPAAKVWDENTKRAIAGYLAGIAVSDQMFGRVIDALGFAGGTPWPRPLVVILWSDHGYGLGLRRGWTKFRFHHEIARVPLMIHDSALNRSWGQNCDKWVSIRDLYLTTLKYAGFDRPAFLANECAGPTASLRQLVGNPGLPTWNRAEHMLSYQYRSILENEENRQPIMACAENVGLPEGVTVKRAPDSEWCVPNALETASHALIFRDPDGSEWSYFYLRHHRADGSSLFERLVDSQAVDVPVPNEELYCLVAATGLTIATSDPVERVNLLKDRESPHYAARRAKANFARGRIEAQLSVAPGSLPVVEWPPAPVA